MSDIELLEASAREAGEIARSFWREDPQVWDKGGDDPVSEADFAVDSHLNATLLRARPDYGWVSEETEDDPARMDASKVFIVDPIDGTRSFVAGEKHWAHSLAVVENGVVTAACVYLPVTDRMFTATLGSGAKLNGETMVASHRDAFEGATILTPRVTLQDRFWKGPVPGFARHFRPSLAYRLALVGQGRFDGMLTLRATWEWDIAAGTLIATEAGARVTDRAGRDIQFNTPSRKSAGVVATALPMHGEVLQALA